MILVPLGVSFKAELNLYCVKLSRALPRRGESMFAARGYTISHEDPRYTVLKMS